MSKYIMLDLFSGLGGASQAMVDHPDWHVIRIDNNPLLLEHAPDTQILNITEVLGNIEVYKKHIFQRVDLIWASPPCLAFSDAYDAPKSKWKREHPDKEYKPDMSLLEVTMEIINLVKPKAWIIENVRGSQPFFQPLLGDVRKIIGPYYLWGDFPLFHANLPAGYKKKDDWSTNPLRSNIRAKIPMQVSEACRQSIQYQTSLQDWQSSRSVL